jgi:NAD(P)-dependent dehydrogenase (short-subunit alcohol dehydrogenase family)
MLEVISYIYLIMLKKKTAIITGGCGLLGWQHALALGEINYNVIILDNDKNKIKLKKKAIEFKLYNFEIFSVNITSEIKVHNVVNKILKKYRKIDILINNAAIDYVPKNKNQVKNQFENFDLSRWNRELNIGINAAFICSKIIGCEMLKKKSGIILNIASDLSIIAPNQNLYKHLKTVKPVTYSVIKHGIHGLTKYLASLWAEKNIRVNTLSPGGIENNQDKKFIKKVKKIIPMRRMARITEYKETIKFLCSKESSYITGQNFVVDGGRTIF